jgi:hypothetical protein
MPACINFITSANDEDNTKITFKNNNFKNRPTIIESLIRRAFVVAVSQTFVLLISNYCFIGKSLLQHTFAMPSLQEFIELEESLVRVYQAELSLLRDLQRSGSSIAINDTEEELSFFGESQEYSDASDNPLEWIFGTEIIPSPPQLKMKTNNVAAKKTEHNNLTRTIQGFVYTSVEQRITNNDSEAISSKTTAGISHYVIQGFFQANSRISATIQLGVDLKRKYQRGKLKPNSSKIVELSCWLASSDGEDLSALNDLSANTMKRNLSLPEWVQKMSQYLEFERMQKEHLNKLQCQFGCTCNKEGLQYDIMPHPGEALPCFTWGWDWDQENEFLNMTTSNNNATNGLDQQGLLDLISCTKGCAKALLLILEAQDNSWLRKI